MTLDPFIDIGGRSRRRSPISYFSGGTLCARDAFTASKHIIPESVKFIAALMRLIIGGLVDGKKQGEIADEIGMNRFRVCRIVVGLQRQFTAFV